VELPQPYILPSKTTFMIASKPDLIKLLSEGVITRPDGQDVTADLASVGLHLDGTFLQYRVPADSAPVIPPEELPTERVTLDVNQTLLFAPGARLLACSLEWIRMPLNYMGFIQTKGSLARGFIMVHMCDGQIDPGFAGQVTFELANFSGITYSLQVGMPIAQLFLLQLTAPVEAGYSGRYQNAEGPTAMKAPRK
jgi:dCTP deaminase